MKKTSDLQQFLTDSARYTPVNVQSKEDDMKVRLQFIKSEYKRIKELKIK